MYAMISSMILQSLLLGCVMRCVYFHVSCASLKYGVLVSAFLGVGWYWGFLSCLLCIVSVCLMVQCFVIGFMRRMVSFQCPGMWNGSNSTWLFVCGYVVVLYLVYFFVCVVFGWFCMCCLV